MCGVSHVTVRRHLKLDSSEGLNRLNLKSDFIHTPKFSAGIARIPKVWPGISLHTASAHGFLSLAVSGS